MQLRIELLVYFSRLQQYLLLGSLRHLEDCQMLVNKGKAVSVAFNKHKRGRKIFCRSKHSDIDFSRQ